MAAQLVSSRSWSLYSGRHRGCWQISLAPKAVLLSWSLAGGPPLPNDRGVQVSLRLAALGARMHLAPGRVQAVLCRRPASRGEDHPSTDLRSAFVGLPSQQHSSACLH